jgi:Na+/H+-dicarboxylate symporter
VNAKWLQRLRSTTALCLLGVGLGIVCGILAGGSEIGRSLGQALDALLRGWTNGFRLLVLPLTGALLFRIVLETPLDRSAGRVGIATPVVFVGLMAIGFILVPLLTIPLLRLPWFAGVEAPLVAGQATAGDAVASGGGPGWADWVDQVLPPNAIAAMVGENLLGIMVVAVLAAASIRATGRDRKAFIAVAGTVVDAAFVLTQWLVWLSPVMLFALGYRFASQRAVETVAFVGAFLAIEVVALLAITLIMLAMTVAAARAGPGAVARAAGPAILTAVVTRSSLATVPGLLKASTTELRLDPMVSATVIPVAGATLKVSRAISSPCRAWFIALVLGLPFGLLDYAGFCLAILILSVSTTGVPRPVSGNRSLPAFVAVGIPAEFVVLLGSLTWVVDSLLSMVNGIAYLTSTVLVGRAVGQRDGVAEAVRPDARALGEPS